MGGGKDGTNGLRLNEDLTRGSSGNSVTYNNKPLGGDDLSEFDVGLVEVYQLVRSVDGQPIDKMENVWNF